MRSPWLAAPVAVTMLLLPACGGEETAGPREGVSAEEITGDVSGDVDLDTARVGGLISLTGDVVRVLGPGAFELRPVDGATDRPVLVLNRHDALKDGQTVQIGGTVRVLDDELAQEYGLDGSSGTSPGQRVVEATTVDQDLPGD